MAHKSICLVFWEIGNVRKERVYKKVFLFSSFSFTSILFTFSIFNPLTQLRFICFQIKGNWMVRVGGCFLWISLLGIIIVALLVFPFTNIELFIVTIMVMLILLKIIEHCWFLYKMMRCNDFDQFGGYQRWIGKSFFCR